jgi:hypothetical protein
VAKRAGEVLVGDHQQIRCEAFGLSSQSILA